MNDLQKLRTLFDSFGMEYEFSTRDNTQSIRFEKGMKKCAGYLGFSCEFVFDDTGKFIETSITE